MNDAGQGQEGHIAQTTVAPTVEGTRTQHHPPQPLLLPPKTLESHNASSGTASTLTPHRLPCHPSWFPLQPTLAVPPQPPPPCRCARLLLRHGAAVDLPSTACGETALHMAARHGLSDHTRLYLRRGARVDAHSAQGETALGVLCATAPGAGQDRLELCRLLVAHGAQVDTRDEARRSPLHEACRAAHAGLARFLLLRGADVNAIDYDGLSPLGLALQSAASRARRRPHLTVQLLLNHGSQRIWPPTFVKVLRSCAAVPEVIEVLFNSYSQIPVSQEWAEAVPEEVFQQHRPFYKSLFQLAGTVRCLQHLCRSAIRENLGSRCHSLIPLLPVPQALREYLLLEPEGVVL